MTTDAQKIANTIIAHLKAQGQLDLLGLVVDSLKSTSAYKNSRHHVVLTSATTLDASELKKISHYLDSSLGSDYQLTKVIDPSLLAGFTLQVNDTFIDASILGKINQVQNTLTAKD